MKPGATILPVASMVFAASSVTVADPHDATVLDADVGSNAWAAAPVDDRSTLDDQIQHREPPDRWRTLRCIVGRRVGRVTVGGSRCSTEVLRGPVVPREGRTDAWEAGWAGRVRHGGRQRHRPGDRTGPRRRGGRRRGGRSRRDRPGRYRRGAGRPGGGAPGAARRPGRRRSAACARRPGRGRARPDRHPRQRGRRDRRPDEAPGHERRELGPGPARQLEGAVRADAGRGPPHGRSGAAAARS